MKFLITDLNIKLDGHKLGFIKNLLDYLRQNPDENTYYFLTNHSTEFKLHSTQKNIIILSTNPDLKFEVHNLILKYARKCFNEYGYIHKICLENQIERLVLLDFDPYQIAIGLTKTPYEINGIWFRPHAVDIFDEVEYGFKNNLFKYLIAKTSTLNSKLRKVFILNDKHKPLSFNKGRKLYFYLPDPVFDYPLNQNFNVRHEFNIPPNNLILLQFGNIDNRKNTENVIRALESMPQNKAAQISLLIVGKHAPGYEDQLFALKSDQAQYQMISKDEFVADDIMEAIFAQSDVIIRMNVGFFGSSGVVGIAARHNKVCIVSDTGVMAHEVKEYKLGKTVAPENIEGIRICLEEFLDDRNKTKIDGTAYIKSHDLSAFAKTLLS